MDDILTVEDVLNLIGDKAQWCREEGESDMRYITQMISNIRNKIKEGNSSDKKPPVCMFDNGDGVLRCSITGKPVGTDTVSCIKFQKNVPTTKKFF